MANDPQTLQNELDEELYEFMVEQINAGADKETIVAQLEKAGTSRQRASEVVDAIYPEIIRAAEEETASLSMVLQAALGGIIAAIIGGTVWAAIGVKTGYEVGFVAIGIGGLAGWAVVFCARGKKGPSLQNIAVLSSLVGIALGKYLAFYYGLKAAVLEDFGQEVAGELTMFSGVVFQLLVENVSVLFSTFDILWVALAVRTAWRIPQGLGVEPVRGGKTRRG